MATKLGNLIQQIQEKTEAGELKWQTTERRGVFQTALPDYALRISSRPNRDNSDDLDFIFTIYNSEGVVIERVADTELREEETEFNPYDVMGELYDQARAQALGTDEAIDKIMEYLGNSDKESST